MTVPSNVSLSESDEFGSTTDERTQPSVDPVLEGWYLDKPALLRVAEPFLIVRGDNAELVFPRREFRFEAIGPSPTRPGTQQLVFVGDVGNVVFETPFGGGWERFIESVPPELVVTPEAAQLEAAGVEPPKPVGLRLAELDLDTAPKPPPPTGPRLAGPDDRPGVQIAVVRETDMSAGKPVVAAAGQEPSTISLPKVECEPEPPSTDTPLIVRHPNAALPESDQSFDESFADSIARRDMELHDLEEADLDEFDLEWVDHDERHLDTIDDREIDEVTLGGFVQLGSDVVQPAMDEEVDPAALDGLLDDESTTPVVVSRWHGRFVGEAADERWHAEAGPVVRNVIAFVSPPLLVVLPALLVVGSIGALFADDSPTVLDRLFGAIVPLSIAWLVVAALRALSVLLETPNPAAFSLKDPIAQRLATAARRVGVAALGLTVVVALMVLAGLLGGSNPWLTDTVSWPLMAVTVLSVTGALGLSAMCTTRVDEVSRLAGVPGDRPMDEG